MNKQSKISADLNPNGIQGDLHKLVPIGAKVLWHLNKKEYTKVSDEKPFSKWTSLNGGTLLIDDDRVLRKDIFTLL
ncbi:MAG: hypothetical protein ACNS62_21815 [Candidatus Cyclobacteriaceae bacterium M3_2C_046]